MTNPITIERIADHVGERVTIRGWLYDLTPKGKLLFLRLRDGTGMTQGVVYRPNVGDELFERLAHLGQESSLIVSGTVKANPAPPACPRGTRSTSKRPKCCKTPSATLSRPKEHGVEFLMDNRHLWLRSSRQWAIMRVRATIKRAIIDFLDNNGFLNIDTPIITPSAAEGTSTLFEVGYFGEKAYLAQTGQLYNEANIMAFGKVYCFGPTFRAEKSKTRRHLAEFWMVEPEIAFCDLDELMALEEAFVSYVVGRRTLEEAGGRTGPAGARRDGAAQRGRAVPAHQLRRGGAAHSRHPRGDRRPGVEGAVGHRVGRRLRLAA
jgi:asparaginyl-tRNA synthetase